MLAGFRRRDAASSESSLKYFLLGSFATAFFLYGVALMFGATGSTNIDAISQALLAQAMCRCWPMLRRRSCSWAWASRSPPRPSMCGLLTSTKELPAPVVGLMSTGPKAAAFAVLLRVHVRSECAGTLLADLGLGRAFHDARKCGALVQTTSSACWPILRSPTPDICWSRSRHNRNWDVGGDVLHRRLCRDECRSVCRRQPLRERGRKVRHARRLRRPGQEVSRAGRDASHSS
jgi:hypothetical protein